ncbi:MAG TPA: hypothetical protein ENK43_00025 [Planctomycetes bacterium]|nr:hypothetical protein [Planctomycetota bacterium]
MRGVSVVTGARHGWPAVTVLTCREILRSAWLPGGLFLFGAWLALYAVDHDRSLESAARRHLAHGMAGIQALLLAWGVFLGVSLKSGARRGVARRLTGAVAVAPAVWFWGRVSGLALCLLLLGSLLGVTLMGYQAVRFGDPKGELVRPLERILPRSATSPDAVLKKPGQRAVLSFAAPPSTGVLRGRLAPRILEVGGGVRSHLPVAVDVTSPGCEVHQRWMIVLKSGRPQRFAKPLPADLWGRSLDIAIEPVVTGPLLRMAPGSLVLFGRERSLWSEVLRGGLAAAAAAAVLGAMTHYGRVYWSLGSSLLLGLGLIVLATSVEALEGGALATIPWARGIVSAASILLPDLGHGDAAQALGRGWALGWGPLAMAALRLLGTSVVLGLCLGAWESRGGRR